MFSAISRLWAMNLATGSRDEVFIEDLPKSVLICNLEQDEDRRIRTLRHLLKLNHVENSLWSNTLYSINRITDVLISAFALGMGSIKLEDTYIQETKGTSKWVEAPSEISRFDWMDHLGQLVYQRAFLDYFEDEIVENGYDWQEVARHYLYKGGHPLFNGIMSGGGRSLIRLAHGIETSSREVTMQALALLCSCWDLTECVPLDFSVLQLSKEPEVGTASSVELFEILKLVRQASLLHRSSDAENEDLATEHWLQWTERDAKSALSQIQKFSALLFVTPANPNQSARLLQASHALRTVLPSTPAHFCHVALSQWWWQALSAYISNGCPELLTAEVEGTSIEGKDWGLIQEKVKDSPNCDPAYIEGMHALQAAGQTWQDDLFLKAAIIAVDRSVGGTSDSTGSM